MKVVYTLLLIVAILLIECLIGGTRLVFSLPSYAIVSAAALLSLFSIRQPIAMPSMACLGSTALFFTYILWRAAHSPVEFLWWPDFYMAIACLMVYLLTALYVTQTRLRTMIIVALLALAVVQLMFGLRQFKGADNWMPFGFIRSDYGARASGSFISSITLAGYLEAVGIFALALAVWSSWRAWYRFALGYLALCCYLGVAITGSRGGYLSSAGSLVFLALLSLWIRRKVNPERFWRSAAIAGVLLAVGLAGAVVLMKQSSMLQQRLALIGKPDVRWYNWLATIDQWKVSPWFGTGAGTHHYYGRYFRRPEQQYDPEHAHSDYLELLAEYGVIGVVGLAIFLFAHLHQSFRAVGVVVKTAPKDPYEPFRDNRLAFQVGTLGAFSAYAIHSITDFNLHIPGHAMIFAFFFGLAANPVAETKPYDPRAVGPWLFRAALPALGIWMAVSGLPKWRGDYLTEQARVALRNRQFEDAIILGERALRHEQRNPFLFHHIGEAYRVPASVLPVPVLRDPQLRKAIEYLDQAIALYPQDETFWVRKGQALDALGDFRAAHEAYLTAIALDPNLGVLSIHFARHLAAMGVPDQAQRLLEEGRERQRQGQGDRPANPLDEL